MTLSVTTLGQGPDLVLVHGWGMNSTVWAGFAEHLAVRYRIYLIDLPGHGDSPYTGVQTLPAWSQACLEVAPERAVWLGWSLGAQLVVQAALDQPERIAALIGLCGTPRFIQAADWPHAMARQTLQQFVSASQLDHRKTLERFLGLQVRGSEAGRETLRALKQGMRSKPDPQPAALAAGLDLLMTVDLRHSLARLACPSGWLFGERDGLVPAVVALALPDWLPHTLTQVVQGAAHAPFLSHPTETLESIFTLLESVYVT